MAVRLLAIYVDHPLPPRRFLVITPVRGWVNPSRYWATRELNKYINNIWKCDILTEADVNCVDMPLRMTWRKMEPVLWVAEVLMLFQWLPPRASCLRSDELRLLPSRLPSDSVSLPSNPPCTINKLVKTAFLSIQHNMSTSTDRS
jgi:hypothetical protein